MRPRWYLVQIDLVFMAELNPQWDGTGYMFVYSWLNIQQIKTKVMNLCDGGRIGIDTADVRLQKI